MVGGSYNGVPVIDVDPFDQDLLKNPYAFWDELRDIGSVAWVPMHEYYIVSRYEEVRSAYINWEDFTTAAGAGLSDIRKPGSWRPPSVIVEVDPPEHTKIRKVMNKIVSPVVVRNWRERFDAEAKHMVQELVGRGTFDGVRDLAEPYVLKVFPESIGMDIPREHAIAIGDLNFNSVGPNNELVKISQARVAPILDWFNASLRGETVRPGGFGEAIFAAEASGELAPGLASGLMMTFLRGGLDTTISSIGSALLLLARNPDQWRALKNNPQLLSGVFNETVRLESPIQTNFRTTTSRCEFFGCQLEPDRKVQLLIGSANRDPRRWQDADAFDLTRDASGHVALAAGVHTCLGQMIARYEFEAVIKALLDHCDTIELAGEPIHRTNNVLRTLDTLPVTVAAA